MRLDVWENNRERGGSYDHMDGKQIDLMPNECGVRPSYSGIAANQVLDHQISEIKPHNCSDFFESARPLLLDP